MKVRITKETNTTNIEALKECTSKKQNKCIKN